VTARPKQPAKPVSEKALREAVRRNREPLRRLPDVWWDPSIRVVMAEFVRLRKAGLV
jgi:hypothetical protein